MSRRRPYPPSPSAPSSTLPENAPRERSPLLNAPPFPLRPHSPSPVPFSENRPLSPSPPSVISSRSATCTYCVGTSPLCINGAPKVQMQHSECPKGHWTIPQKTLWLLGDLAKGGITQFLKALVPSLPGEHYFSLASDFKRDELAWPNVRPGIPPLLTSPYITHLVSRHPDHTPLTPTEYALLSSSQKVIVHCHGPSQWSQDCIDYAASLLSLCSLPSLPSPLPSLPPSAPLCSLVCNSKYTLSNIRVPSLFSPTIIPLPITITRSPFTRMEDRKYLLSLLSPSSLPPPSELVPWWIYTGRISPEKNLSRLLSLSSQVPSELFIVSDGYLPGTHSIPWQDDLSRIYNATDTCICTSSSEGGPIFAAEALLHGNTVFSTPVGHMLEILPPSHILSETVPDILYRPFSLERSSEQIALAWRAAQYFARSIPEWKRASKMSPIR